MRDTRWTGDKTQEQLKPQSSCSSLVVHPEPGYFFMHTCVNRATHIDDNKCTIYLLWQRKMHITMTTKPPQRERDSNSHPGFCIPIIAELFFFHFHISSKGGGVLLQIGKCVNILVSVSQWEKPGIPHREKNHASKGSVMPSCGFWVLLSGWKQTIQTLFHFKTSSDWKIRLEHLKFIGSSERNSAFLLFNCFQIVKVIVLTENGTKTF